LGTSVVEAFGAGFVIGGPFVLWGLLLIFDRDRTWRVQNQRNIVSGTVKERTLTWDRRQIMFGAILILLGTFLFFIMGLNGFRIQAAVNEAAAISATATAAATLP